MLRCVHFHAVRPLFTDNVCVTAMDVVYPLMVVATADRHVLVFNLNNPTTPFKTVQSPLRMQTRSVACFADGTGFSVSSIEGRVAVQHLDESKASSNFSFKVCTCET